MSARLRTIFRAPPEVALASSLALAAVGIVGVSLCLSDLARLDGPTAARWFNVAAALIAGGVLGAGSVALKGVALRVMFAALVVVMFAVLPLRAEPITWRVGSASGSTAVEYGYSPGPKRIVLTRDGATATFRGIQFRPWADLSRKDVGWTGCLVAPAGVSSEEIRGGARGEPAPSGGCAR